MPRTRALTYWICEHDVNPVYNIRTRTRRKAIERRGEYSPEIYGPPRKVTAWFYDPFDLLAQCLGEGRGGWED